LIHLFALVSLFFADWQVFFSPNGGAEEAIVRNIDSTRSHILVQAYSFTSEPIAAALMRAKQRGCFVSVVLDKGQLKAKGSQWHICREHGIPVGFDMKAKIQHSKVLILDSTKIITGSYNFSKAADKSNAENLLILEDRKLALHYIKEWHKRKKYSRSNTE
jgi:phosphatidylserine/phosphatidylglycerophosphate/cardiolipin synthase-like enzyme